MIFTGIVVLLPLPPSSPPPSASLLAGGGGGMKSMALSTSPQAVVVGVLVLTKTLVVTGSGPCTTTSP